MKYRDQLKGMGNAIKIIVATKQGTICDKNYLQISKISTMRSFTSRVDRTQMNPCGPRDPVVSHYRRSLAGGR